jgi:hypothetical protein
VIQRTLLKKRIASSLEIIKISFWNLKIIRQSRGFFVGQKMWGFLWIYERFSGWKAHTCLGIQAASVKTLVSFIESYSFISSHLQSVLCAELVLSRNWQLEVVDALQFAWLVLVVLTMLIWKLWTQEQIATSVSRRIHVYGRRYRHCTVRKVPKNFISTLNFHQAETIKSK